jgi:hypothetical protein
MSELNLNTISEVSTDGIIESATNVNVNSYNALIDTFNQLYAHIKVIYTGKLTPVTVVIVISELIQLVEKYKTLTGQQKKNMVINVIKKLVNEETDKYTEEEQAALMLLINTTLPTMIDTTIDAINGLMKFTKDKTKNTFFSRFLCCK